MADPLSISAGIVSIVVPALHGIRLLLNDLDKIKNAPEAVERLREDINSISASLSLLKDIEESVWTSLGTAVANHSEATLKSCETACDTIRGDLQRWTKRSKGGTLSWVDRVNVGFFRDRQLKAHSGQLHTYRLTFNSIVGTATLYDIIQESVSHASADRFHRYSSIRNSQLTDEVRQSIASQQRSIAAASNSTQTEVAVVERTLGEVQSCPTDDLNADEEEDDIDITITTLKDLMDALTLSQTLLQELLSKTEAIETTKAAERIGTTNITFGTNYKGMQMGNNYGSTTWNGK